MAQILDVGCGFAGGVHHKRSGIGLDLNRGMCDVVADAHCLPFRPEIFDKVLLYGILEHLNDPTRCLNECIAVSKTDARFEIVIPVDARGSIVLLKTMLLEFPWGAWRAVRAWWRWAITFRRIRKHQTPHRNCIQPRHISRFLRIDGIEVRGGTHAWFRGKKGTIMRKLTENPPQLGVEKSTYIKARKTL